LAASLNIQKSARDVSPKSDQVFLISAAAMSAYFLHLEIKSRQYGCKINQQAGQSSHGLECGLWR